MRKIGSYARYARILADDLYDEQIYYLNNPNDIMMYEYCNKDGLCIFKKFPNPEDYLLDMCAELNDRDRVEYRAVKRVGKKLREYKKRHHL